MRNLGSIANWQTSPTNSLVLSEVGPRGYDGKKEKAMIELTKEQVQAIENQQTKPLHMVNPATKEVFVLIRKDVYDLTCNIVGGQGRVWNDAVDDDLIRKRT